MNEQNGTWTNQFFFIGLTDDSRMQIPLFLIFLAIYDLTVVGNLGIILAIRKSSKLQTPMYFLLGNLSFLDFLYSSTVCPRLLSDIFRERKAISLYECALQQCLVCGFAAVEFFLLAAMAIDRYVAVCDPLHYTTVISMRLCAQLVIGSYANGFLQSTLFTGLTFQLPFCGNVVNHFFCDILPLLNLSCVSTLYFEALLFGFCCITLGSTVVVVVISYAKIIAAIVKMSTGDGKQRAFSTCSSHFSCVTLLYGTVCFMYFRPSSSYSLDRDKVVSVFYTLIIPMLNPLIYSLRNKEMKQSMKMMFRNKCLLLT